MRNWMYILISIAFISCKNDCNTNDFNSLSDTIVMGQSKNMKIIFESFLLKPKLGLMHGNYFDVNNDGKPDYFIWIEQVNDYDNKMHIKSSISSINRDFLIYGRLIIDTMFLNEIKTSIKDSLNHVYIDSFFYYSCTRINSNDSIININKNRFEATPLVENELLTQNNYFRDDTSYFQIENYVHTTYELGIDRRDTLLTKKKTYSNYCSFLPFDKEYYFGFKLKESEITRLGWIKLKIDQNYNITIIENAIQK
jgi:hypothetical protein